MSDNKTQEQIIQDLMRINEQQALEIENLKRQNEQIAKQMDRFEYLTQFLKKGIKIRQEQKVSNSLACMIETLEYSEEGQIQKYCQLSKRFNNIIVQNVCERQSRCLTRLAIEKGDQKNELNYKSAEDLDGYGYMINSHDIIIQGRKLDFMKNYAKLGQKVQTNAFVCTKLFIYMSFQIYKMNGDNHVQIAQYFAVVDIDSLQPINVIKLKNGIKNLEQQGEYINFQATEYVSKPQMVYIFKDKDLIHEIDLKITYSNQENADQIQISSIFDNGNLHTVEDQIYCLRQDKFNFEIQSRIKLPNDITLWSSHLNNPIFWKRGQHYMIDIKQDNYNLIPIALEGIVPDGYTINDIGQIGHHGQQMNKTESLFVIVQKDQNKNTRKHFIQKVKVVQNKEQKFSLHKYDHSDIRICSAVAKDNWNVFRAIGNKTIKTTYF